QGENAALDIVRAIRTANEFNTACPTGKRIEVLIVGRGGGAAEDLWAFNEEIVARAIRSSAIPVISAVGHEIDTTIADLVADMRAATPSAAAEVVAAHEEELEHRIANASARMIQAGKYALLKRRGAVDDLHSSLIGASGELLSEANRRYLRVSSRLTPSHLKSVLGETRNRHSVLEKRHQTAVSDVLLKKVKAFELAARSLNTLSPLNVLNRGFSITENEAGVILHSSDQTCEGEKVRIRLSSGTLRAEVLSKE
ncbi:MAG TPA: exodeoxyribonuclease VII large subunit, partial [Pyrinomonadaceae bacterium]|nr:exodeoxyribonuclease VII large subunit [Pyrinomonadaceae bacterium]